MNKTDLVSMLTVEIIKQQILIGLKHPSPGLIKEAVDTAEAVVDELARQVAERAAAAAPPPVEPVTPPVPPKP